MALKCTKTSSPSSREMKPNPLSGLNHFTVPVVKAIPSFRGRSRTSRFDGLPAGSPAEGTARSRVMRCGNDAEPHLDDASLPIAEGVQDRLEMLLEQGRTGGLRWRYGVRVLDEVAEGQVLLLADRALQGDGGPEQQDLLDPPRRQVDQHADLARIGLVAEGLEELLPGLGHLVDVLGDVDR